MWELRCSVESLVDLQSLSPAMSVSSLSRFAKKSGAKLGYDVCEDDLYSFLDRKPGSVDASRRAAGGGGKKGRRHAGDALLMRKLSRHAYLVKSIVGAGDGSGTGGGRGSDGPAAAGGGGNTGTALLGKKRRVRLLSDHMQDFNIAVPYSLNRKNRWQAADDSATGCLKALAESADAATRGDDHVRLSVIESYINLNRSLGDHGQVTAYRELDARGQLLVDKAARSARGAPLKNLLNVPPAAKAAAADASEPEHIHVQYNYARPHTSPKVMGANSSAKGRNIKSVRRMYYNGCAQTRQQALNAGRLAAAAADDFYVSPLPLSDAALAAAAERQEFAALYYQRPRRLFTLADFVVDSAAAPVIVRRGKDTAAAAGRAKDDIEDQFVITDGVTAQLSEAEEDPLGDQLDDDSDAEVPAAKVAAADAWLKRHNDAYATFARFSVPATARGIADAAAWTALCARLLAGGGATHALNALCVAVDASAALRRALPTRPDDDSAPLLVVVFGYDAAGDALHVLVNGAFKAPQLDAGRFVGGDGATVDGLLDEIVRACATPSTEFPPVQKQKVVANQTRNFQSKKLYVVPSATTITEIIEREVKWMADYEGTRAVHAELGAIYEKVPDDAISLDSDVGDDDCEQDAVQDRPDAGDSDDDFDDDFEHIDIDEELRSIEGTPDETPEPRPATPRRQKCRVCRGGAAWSLVRATYCDHTFCVGCLGETFARRAAAATGGRAALAALTLACPLPDCDGCVSLAALPALVPLPTVAKYALARHLTRGILAEADLLVECPQCFAYLSDVDGGEYNHVACDRCPNVFCAQCRQQPHWPLSCAQLTAWEAKLRQQANRAVGADNAIAGEFFERCSKARACRLDGRAIRQLNKNLGQLKHTAALFNRTRKLALYMVEFGFAWLYMNRSAAMKKGEFSHLKSSLIGLANRQERIDTEALFCGALTDAENLRNKLIDMAQHTDGIIAKFQSVGRG